MTASSTWKCAGVAVPVTDFTGQVVGALGISGPIWRLSNQALHASAQVVQAAADRLSAESAPKARHKRRSRKRPETRASGDFAG